MEVGVLGSGGVEWSRVEWGEVCIDAVGVTEAGKLGVGVLYRRQNYSWSV